MPIIQFLDDLEDRLERVSAKGQRMRDSMRQAVADSENFLPILSEMITSSGEFAEQAKLMLQQVAAGITSTRELRTHYADAAIGASTLREEMAKLDLDAAGRKIAQLNLDLLKGSATLGEVAHKLRETGDMTATTVASIIEAAERGGANLDTLIEKLRQIAQLVQGSELEGLVKGIMQALEAGDFG